MVEKFSHLTNGGSRYFMPLTTSFFDCNRCGNIFCGCLDDEHSQMPYPGNRSIMPSSPKETSIEQMIDALDTTMWFSSEEYLKPLKKSIWWYLTHPYSDHQVKFDKKSFLATLLDEYLSEYPLLPLESPSNYLSFSYQPSDNHNSPYSGQIFIAELYRNLGLHAECMLHIQRIKEVQPLVYRAYKLWIDRIEQVNNSGLTLATPILGKVGYSILNQLLNEIILT